MEDFHHGVAERVLKLLQVQCFDGLFVICALSVISLSFGENDCLFRRLLHSCMETGS